MLVNETRRAYNKTPALQPKFDLDAAKASIKDMQKRGGYNNPFGGSMEEMEDFAKDIVGRLNERFSDLDSRKDGWAATPEFARDTLMSRRESVTKSGQLMESREIGLGRYSSAEEVYKAATVVQRQLNQMLREISKEFGFPYSDVTQKTINVDDGRDRKTIYYVNKKTRSSTATLPQWART